jgi:hypothetical protein
LLTILNTNFLMPSKLQASNLHLFSPRKSIYLLPLQLLESH